MISFGSTQRYFLYREPTDMRKSFDGLCGLGRVCKLQPEQRSGNDPHGAEVLRPLLITRG